MAELDVLGVLGPHVVAEQLFIVLRVSAACRLLRTDFHIDLSFYEHSMLAHSAMCIACAALMLSCVYCGDELSATTQQLLSRISGVDLSELAICRAILQQSAVDSLKSHSTPTPSNTPAGAEKCDAAGRESPDSIMDPFAGERDEQPRAKRHAPAGAFGDNSNSTFSPYSLRSPHHIHAWLHLIRPLGVQELRGLSCARAEAACGRLACCGDWRGGAECNCTHTPILKAIRALYYVLFRALCV